MNKIENKYKITIGSDPEIFIEDSTTGTTISAIGMIPGTKHDPHPITDKGHFIQTDNIAFEFNIPPCNTEDEFVKEITFVKDYLEVIAETNNAKLSIKASDEIEDIYLIDPQAQEFGCEPDLNPYLMEENPRPDSDTNLRCVGGHIHIGYPNPTQETSEKIVKAFDIFVTLPALLIDTDDRRRELYGKAGAFRFKEPWGVECRALSNFWIHSEDKMRWVYQQTIKAVNTVLDNQIQELFDKYSEEVVTAINTNDKALAKSLLSQIFKEEIVLVN